MEEIRNGTLYRTRLPPLPPRRNQVVPQGREVLMEINARSRSATFPQASTASPKEGEEGCGLPRGELREKQKAKRIYFTLETQFRAYYEKAANPHRRYRRVAVAAAGDASGQRGVPSGLCVQPPPGRQIVRHGHIQVNGRKVNIPSFQCKVGDEIAIREGSKALTASRTAKNFAAAQRSVPWIDINSRQPVGQDRCAAEARGFQLPVNEQLIVELYSK